MDSSPEGHSDIFPGSGNIELPSTPDIMERAANATPTPQPPPAHPPKIRIRRRRTLIPSAQQQQQQQQSMAAQLTRTEDVPIPTIELSHLEAPPAGLLPSEEEQQHKEPMEGYLAPFPHSLTRLVSPPRTPAPHRRGFFSDNAISTPRERDWSFTGHSIHRPSSTLSQASNSTDSSLDSSDSLPSYGESCTSPDSDGADPFVFPDTNDRPHNELLSPVDFSSSNHRSNKRTKTGRSRRDIWSSEMDDHLWLVYMSYVADPTKTPFKTMPGGPPPLGVCHRVAREARKSWRGTRGAVGALSPVSEDGRVDKFVNLDGTAPASSRARETSVPVIRSSGSSETIRNDQAPLTRRRSSDEITRKPPVKWPMSESSTRRRLRELCKRKPQFASSQQRLRQTRTPSPSFESATLRPPRNRPRATSPQQGSSFATAAVAAAAAAARSSSSSFDTRDMNVTLTTSTAKSMQPDGPLSQLSYEASKEAAAAAATATVSAADPFLSHVSDEWPGQSTIRPNVHQKSQSLQLGLGLGGSSSAREYRRLASPFQEATRHHRTWHMQNSSASGNLFGGSLAGSETATRIAAAAPAAAVASRLESPLEIHAPRPMSGSMKRRAQYQLGREMVNDEGDEAAHPGFIRDLFRRPPMLLSHSERPVRHRGFSMGAMQDTSAVNHAAAAAATGLPAFRPLADLFTPPPSSQDSTMTDTNATTFARDDLAGARAAPATATAQRDFRQPAFLQASNYLHLRAPTASLDTIARLGSPFAPIAPTVVVAAPQPGSGSANLGLSNTFPRSLFPHGLDTLTSLDQHQQQHQHQQHFHNNP